LKKKKERKKEKKRLEHLKEKSTVKNSWGFGYFSCKYSKGTLFLIPAATDPQCPIRYS
jgi:hypothetical protein